METMVLHGELVVEELESLAELDLFAEELPERLNNAATPMGSASTLSCAGTFGGCAACLSSLCSLA
ncbi:MAG: hypothetical protein KatS3mg057_2605 [Herpetosiphonaceae bacterium]|nr:MAG: hypothetical protein KatS3mg057_2605 [Herpetosiphonaceae bacterium]